MKYRNEFPRDARARVEAEKLRAYRALEQEVRGTESWRREGAFIRCVMQVFLGFAREALAFGKHSGHRAWSDRDLDQRCREVLVPIVIDAWEDKAKDLGIRKMFSSSHHWGYSLDDDARRKIENSREWKEYQELLLNTLESQSGRAVDGVLRQQEQAGGLAPKPNEQRETTPIGVPRPFPHAAKWEDIEISFLSDERVQITVGTQSETRNYAEMGFASKKNGTPVLAWVTLSAMARAGGVMRFACDSRKWAEVEKRMQEIRKVLRHMFGLTDDPLPFTKKARRGSEDFGYCAKIKLDCRPSYES